MKVGGNEVKAAYLGSRQVSRVVFRGKDMLSGGDDAAVVSDLIEKHGMTEAFRLFAEDNIALDSLTNITTRFFAAAAKSVTETYASEFYRFSANSSSAGEKKQDNAGLICTPSTNTTAGQDDYADLPLFACFDCNYTIDATTLEPVIHAVKGVRGAFDSAPADSFVGVIQMTGWVRRSIGETTKTVEYRAQEAAGFEPLPEGVRALDNSVRPFVIHAKYAAGFNRAGRLSSVSGVPAAAYRYGSVGSAVASHDEQIGYWREWGAQCGGFGLCDIAFYQLMLELKYAVLGSREVMAGCRDYNFSYAAAVSERGVKRVLLTTAQAWFLVVGSCVSLGSSSRREDPASYDVCDLARIVSIEDVAVDGTLYKAVNLDAETPFDVAAGETYVTTQPWYTGATDAVLGADGSPVDNASGKEPFKLQGIELMLGVYEIPGDTSLYQDAENGYIVHTNRLAKNVRAGGAGVDPAVVGTIPKEDSAVWGYVAELNWDANRQEGYMLPAQFGGNSSTGYRAGVYRESLAEIGWREWRAFGALHDVDVSGLACAPLDNGLTSAYWAVGARACGTGGNRGVYMA